ncbi:hypothetical protein HK101_006155 [Irineochytrium annulatum]|nr:hypothetical protein HK101_006155 [Irineochytrium annulatum]
MGGGYSRAPPQEIRPVGRPPESDRKDLPAIHPAQPNGAYGAAADGRPPGPLQPHHSPRPSSAGPKSSSAGSPKMGADNGLRPPIGGMGRGAPRRLSPVPAEGQQQQQAFQPRFDPMDTYERAPPAGYPADAARQQPPAGNQQNTQVQQLQSGYTRNDHPSPRPGESASRQTDSPNPPKQLLPRGGERMDLDVGVNTAAKRGATDDGVQPAKEAKGKKGSRKSGGGKQSKKAAAAAAAAAAGGSGSAVQSAASSPQVSHSTKLFAPTIAVAPSTQAPTKQSSQRMETDQVEPTDRPADPPTATAPIEPARASDPAPAASQPEPLIPKVPIDVSPAPLVAWPPAGPGRADDRVGGSAGISEAIRQVDENYDDDPPAAEPKPAASAEEGASASAAAVSSGVKSSEDDGKVASNGPQDEEVEEEVEAGGVILPRGSADDGKAGEDKPGPPA